MIGYKFFKENNISWRYLHGAIIPLTMPHVKIELSTLEAYKLLIKKNIFLLRWDEKFDGSTGGEWWHIIKDEPEDISSLSKKTRYMIRKGEKSYRVRLCGQQYIYSHGYPVYKVAFERYETFEKCFSEEEFKAALLKLPNSTEFWGVFDKKDNRLVAFSENLVRDEACFYSTMWFDPLSMKNFSGYILFHTMNKYYLNEQKLKYVSDGARSINHQTNIHHFLQSKFGFRKAYSSLRLIYAPGIYPIVYLLFPLRKIFKRSSFSFFQKVSVLLEQERIKRACTHNPWKTNE